MSTPIIPRRVLFANPDRAAVRLSPDGEFLTWLAPLDGVLNLWIAPRTNLDAARPLTRDTGRGIRIYHWTHTGEHLLYLQDKNGDENWRIHSVDIHSTEARDLTPFEQVQAQVKQLSTRHPDSVVVADNRRDPKWHDLYRIDIRTGDAELLYQNDTYYRVEVDHDFQLRVATRLEEDGSAQYDYYHQGLWQPWMTISPEDSLNTEILGFSESNEVLYLIDSRDRNTGALVETVPGSDTRNLLAEDRRTDASDVLRHPRTRRPQAVAFIHERKQWQILDPQLDPDFSFLREQSRGEWQVGSRSMDDRFWIVIEEFDDGPTRFSLFDRPNRHLNFLFTNRTNLEGQSLARMHSFTMQARDGLEMVGYYTLPPGIGLDASGFPSQPLPMVFNPHGGPWHRNYWGYNAMHQWLANRGYAVLAINFRASTGFGKAFVNAGNREWGGKIIDDQVDAVRWAIDRGIADPEKIAIMGGSFGGYSVLAGLAFHPELYACGIDLVGVANLLTFMRTIPPYWTPFLPLLKARVGDQDTEEGKAMLERQSPVQHVDRIRRPLLVAQGAHDPRVVKAESDQIVEAVRAKGLPVEYLLFPDEGHGFARPENNFAFYAAAERFLAEHLGGRCEEVGKDFEESSVEVL